MVVFAIILAIFCSASLGYDIDGIAANSTIHQRILKGKDATEGQFPYQVSLRINNKHFCGGSIIASKWILTAAHCIINVHKSKWTVVVDTLLLDNGGTAYEVEKLIPHKLFIKELVRNDIALIKLKDDIKFSSNVQTIGVETDKVDQVDCVVSGWGQTSRLSSKPTNHLQYLETKTLSHRRCLLGIYGRDKICTNSPVGEGACQGDSGGPLVANGKQIGVASFVIFTCGIGFPDFYTRVSHYTKWIEKTMKRN